MQAYLTQESCYNVAASNGQLAGHNDYFYNNTCIIDQTAKGNQSNYASFDCTASQDTWPITYDNKIYIANGSSTNVGLCDATEEGIQSYKSYDLGTQIFGTYPNYTEIINQARQILFD